MNTSIKILRKPIEVDFSSVLVTYQSKNGCWRGFVFPYNITTEAETKKQAENALEEMAEVYEEGLKKYNFPSHLKKVPLADEEDKDVFNHLAFQALINQGKIDNSTCHAKTRTIPIK
jgi:predicted RNase H-like HicB family nuclease